jgi:transposase-like protein
MICKHCKNDTFYQLQNDYIKCKSCTKKYSLKKLKTDENILIGFWQNKTALELSKDLNLNYKTIKARFDELRYKLSKFLEEEYFKIPKDYSEYEEFYYFSKKQKLLNIKSLYEAVNIIGFYSNEKVYTLLMPNLKHRRESKNEGFEEYLSWHKIYSKESYKTKLYDFWKFLEENLKKYKGVEYDRFFFYLKECEFKFNYEKEEQLEILRNL